MVYLQLGTGSCDNDQCYMEFTSSLGKDSRGLQSNSSAYSLGKDLPDLPDLPALPTNKTSMSPMSPMSPASAIAKPAVRRPATQVTIKKSSANAQPSMAAVARALELIAAYAVSRGYTLREIPDAYVARVDEYVQKLVDDEHAAEAAVGQVDGGKKMKKQTGVKKVFTAVMDAIKHVASPS